MANHKPTDIPLLWDLNRKLTFAIGVAQANNLLPPNLLEMWKSFLCDASNGREYEGIDEILGDLKRFVYGPLGPSREMVEEAMIGWGILVGITGRNLEQEGMGES